jgi:predicted phosphodiesterase
MCDLNRTALLCIGFLIVFHCTICEALEIIKGPYLQNVTKTGITVMWETDEVSNSVVYYGPTSQYGSSKTDTSSTSIHEIILDKLDVETTYHYSVKSGTVSSDDNTFQTAVNDKTPFTFAVLGDNRTVPNIHTQVINSIIQNNPDIVLNSGDIITSDSYSQFEREFFTPAAPLMKNTPLYVAIGNHEGDSEWFYKLLSYPDPENYYSFNYGNAHFLIIDSNKPYSTSSTQYSWIEEDLNSEAAKRADWIFVCFHHPPWSQMWDSPGYTGTASVRQYLVPFFEQYKVDIVFNGHTHDYERGIKNGIYYIITGGGGSALDKVKTGDWDHIDIWLSEYHHCFVEINQGLLQFKAIKIDGQVIDEFQIEKQVTSLHSEYGTAESGNGQLKVIPAIHGSCYVIKVPFRHRNVEIAVYSLSGQLIARLFTGNSNQVKWKPSENTRGAFVVKATMDNYNLYNKFIIAH